MNRSRYRNRILIAAFAISLCPLAIGKGFGEEFQGVGTVLALNPAEGMVLLDHEAIPGLMPPMKMAFQVALPDLLKDLKQGDRVRFTLKAEGEATAITDIGKIKRFGFHDSDSMPNEVRAKLSGFGVTSIESNGPMLRKDGCSAVQPASLKKGSLGKSLGTALFAVGEAWCSCSHRT